MSRYSHEDYTRALLNLLPTGIAWNRLSDSVQHGLMSALAKAYQQSDADACALLTGAFPETADALIDEWYETLGLNDECGTSALAADKAQARRFILAKLLSTGGQSVAYFTELAATMGFVVSIREYRVPLCGFSSCGATLNTRDNSFIWTVEVQPPGDEVTTSTAYLECLFRRYAPAHTQVMFEYLSAYTAALSVLSVAAANSVSGYLSGDAGVVVSGVAVTVTLKAMNGRHYVLQAVTDSNGFYTATAESVDYFNGYYSAYADAVVDMPDDVTVSLRSELTLLNYTGQEDEKN